MVLGDGLVALLVLGFWLFCLFDVITTDESLMRNLSKGWWIVIVLLFSVVGSIMWLVAGRPQGQRGPGLPYKGNRGTGSSDRSTSSWDAGASPARRGPVAPDDDPDFLAHVRRQNAEDKDMLSRWEADLRAREERLRGQRAGADDDAAPSSG